jgi:diguanylate cyclase (GGDEF)-like protein
MMPALITESGIYFLAPLAVALVIFHLYWRFRGTYLLQWTLSFAALALFHLTTALIVSGSFSGAGGLQWSTLLLSIGGGAAAYAQLALLFLGAMAIAGRGATTLRNTSRLVAVAGAIGATTGTIPFLIASAGPVHLYFNVGLHALVAAIVFTGSAFLLRRSRGSGFNVAALAITVSGFVSLLQFISIMRALFAAGESVSHTTIAMLSLAGSGSFLLGAILTVLEDQRESTAEATSEVEHLAYHDTVTGLPNRSLFSDRLAVALTHAQRHRYKLAVLFLDMDRFKQINDSLGHTIGDRLLRIVAERITSAVRSEDTVARFGGDEFTVLIHIIGKVEDAGKIAQKILDSLKAPILIDNREFVVTSSAGIAIYPVDGTDGETLIRNADTAMYRAKDAGRNAYHFYAPAMNHRAVEALELENGLRRAVENEEFVLYYQPLVDVPSGTVFGVEALIRWQHPEHGLLAPESFIAAAEESGVIIPIGRWVLREACRQVSEWHRQGHRVVLAVNLSARQFQAPDLLEQVSDALSASRLRPQFLELEITEGYAMRDVEKVIATLHKLKKLGVRIAIDDFGTGYSCLSYLKQFPIDTLKLDGSFLRDIGSVQDQQIALGVIALAHSLNLKVIAEGVETIGQLAFLRANACDRLQGFLFSRPMPPANFDGFFLNKDILKLATAVN